MSIRNGLFSAYNRVFNYFMRPKFAFLTPSHSNRQLVKGAAYYQQMEHLARRKENQRQVRRAQMDEFDRMEEDVLNQYEDQGRDDSNVDPENVILQLDRIEVLRKIKDIELHGNLYPPEEVECFRLIAKVHLEEENAEANLEAFFEKHPSQRKHKILGQI